ncbi:MAG TPA: hypothetical protein PK208_08960 [Fibrobacteria bacterium]|nr:hypothetical protein [Fibrobacteria bacterium]
MASNIFLALLLPGLAAAAVPVRVPSPMESGKTIPLEEGARLPDGTWVVEDTGRAVWYSVDRGANWALVPESDTEFPEVFGSAVVDVEERRYWMSSTGWRDMSMPSSYKDGTESFFSSSGERSFVDANGGRYYVSDDSLRTWREVLQLPTSSLPPEGQETVFDRGLGRYWFTVADSQYLRGTTDGQNWMRIPLPQGVMPFSTYFDPEDAGIAIVGMDASMEPGYWWTTDQGMNWRRLEMKQPGEMVQRIGTGVYASLTMDGQSQTHWIGSTRNGPWTKVELAGVEAIFTDGGRIYAVGSEGLFQIELSDVGVRPSMARSSFAMRRIDGRLQIEIPKGMTGSSWKMLAANGSLLASGTVRNTALVVDLPGEPAWLWLGDRAQSLPRF